MAKDTTRFKLNPSIKFNNTPSYKVFIEQGVNETPALKRYVSTSGYYIIDQHTQSGLSVLCLDRFDKPTQDQLIELAKQYHSEFLTDLRMSFNFWLIWKYGVQLQGKFNTLHTNTIVTWVGNDRLFDVFAVKDKIARKSREIINSKYG